MYYLILTKQQLLVDNLFVNLFLGIYSSVLDIIPHLEPWTAQQLQLSSCCSYFHWYVSITFLFTNTIPYWVFLLIDLCTASDSLESISCSSQQCRQVNVFVFYYSFSGTRGGFWMWYFKMEESQLPSWPHYCTRGERRGLWVFVRRWSVWEWTDQGRKNVIRMVTFFSVNCCCFFK